MFNRRIAFLNIILVLFIFLMSGCNASTINPKSTVPLKFDESADAANPPESVEDESIKEGDDMITIKISVGGDSFTARFYDNETSQVVINNMPFTVNMSDFNGQEKVGTLSQTPPATSTEKPTTIHAGELFVWSGNNLVLFYTTFSNSYGGYIPLGYIEDVSSLSDALGNGSVEVSLSISE